MWYALISNCFHLFGMVNILKCCFGSPWPHPGVASQRIRYVYHIALASRRTFWRIERTIWYNFIIGVAGRHLGCHDLRWRGLVVCGFCKSNQNCRGSVFQSLPTSCSRTTANLENSPKVAFSSSFSFGSCDETIAQKPIQRFNLDGWRFYAKGCACDQKNTQKDISSDNASKVFDVFEAKISDVQRWKCS